MNPTSSYTSASLYVGDLHPSVTEALLFEIFKAVGPVVSIRVCRDAVTRRSLGYAYVNFHNIVDAQRALDSLNYTPIKGKPCRIMWSYRDPSKRKSGAGNVFIKNLDKSIDNKALYDTFSTFGTILSCKVVTDDKGNSKGYGFVHYETEEAADQAIDKVHGMLLNGKIVYVGPFIPKTQRKSGVDPDHYTNLYVKHIDKSWGDKELAEVFSDFGPIKSCVVMTNEGEEGNRGFGFVNFEEHEHANACVEALHGKRKLGNCEKELYVQRAMRKQERESWLKQKREERAEKYQGINLYVKNLDDSIDEAKLTEIFSPFGTITSCKVMYDTEKKVSKGFGFVCFTTPDEASKAVTAMHSTMLAGKPLYVALAERKDMRRARLEAHYMAHAHAHASGHGLASHLAQGPHVAGRGLAVAQQRGMPYGQAPPVFYGHAGAIPATGARFPMYGHQVHAVRRWTPAGKPVGGGRGGAGAGGSTGGARGFKYTANVRNQPGGGRKPGGGLGGSITGGVLADASPDQQKQILGESLFPRIRAVKPEQAAKITGMLLESMEIADLLHLLESQETLLEKIDEALMVLKEHAQQAERAAAELRSAGGAEPVVGGATGDGAEAVSGEAGPATGGTAGGAEGAEEQQAAEPAAV